MEKNIRVVGAIIEKDGKILIARRLYGIEVYEEGEDGITAIKREIREEFEADIEVRDYLCTVRHRYPEFSIMMDCYICRLTGDELKLHDHSEVMWIDPDKRGVDWARADRKVIRAYRKRIC